MNVFDIIITVLLLFGFVKGLMKGLFVEIASLVAIIAGVYGAIHFSYFIAEILKDTIDWDEKYISLTAFAGTFIIIIVVVALLGKAFTKLADFASLGMLNKILGGVFGALKIGLILSVLFLFFNKMNNTLPFVKKETIDESILFLPVKKIAPTIFPSIIKDDEIDENAIDNLIKKTN